MSNEVIDWAIDQELKGGAARKLILILLANRADEQWVCWPSRRKLATESGVSLAQVGKHLLALEEEGLIRRVPWQREDGGQGSNCYLIGPTAVTPYSFSRRGGAHFRAGGSSETSRTPTPKRGPKNPQGKPTAKPSSSAAREESRRRSPADAVETQKGANTFDGIIMAELPTDLDSKQINYLVTQARRNPDAYARQIETIKSRARGLWREASELAADRFRELETPEAIDDRWSMDHMTYQYVLVLRKKKLPPWLIGPLLPHLESAPGSIKKAA